MTDEGTPSRRERQREATSDEIKQVARQQMAEEGTAGLSLRGIARQMGLSAPALYRYYPSRDDLITALIVDAFHALGDATQAAQVGLPTGDYAGRFLAMTAGYRQWALDHPVDFALIYGNPIPGYHAPDDLTAPAVRRSTAPLVNLLNESWQAGALAPLTRAINPAVEAHLVDWMRQAGYTMPSQLIHEALAGWAHMQGLITLELFNHLQPTVGDTAAFYATEMRRYLERLGMHPTNEA